MESEDGKVEKAIAFGGMCSVDHDEDQRHVVRAGYAGLPTIYYLRAQFLTNRGVRYTKYLVLFLNNIIPSKSRTTCTHLLMIGTWTFNFMGKTGRSSLLQLTLCSSASSMLHGYAGPHLLL